MSNPITRIITSHLLAKPPAADPSEAAFSEILPTDGPALGGTAISTEGREATETAILSVPQLVAYWARVAPDAPALSDGSETICYGDLDRRANQLAHHLIALGVGLESIVGLCLERSLDSILCALGILKAGAAYLPLDPAYPIERLAFMLNDARPQVLITRNQIAEQLPTGPWQVVTTESAGSQTDCRLTEAPTIKVRPEDLAYVIYTSGSTGQPKGVEITHGSLMNLITWHKRAFNVTSTDNASVVAGVGFDASVWETWPYLSSGASLHLPDEEQRVSPERLRDWFVAKEITIGFLPTVLAERVMTLTWPAHTALRYLLTGADTLHRYPSNNLPFKLINNYGPTECTVVATSGIVVSGVSRDALPTIGRPIANTQVYILDELLRQVAVGETGELHIAGKGLARGYLNSPELTAAKFIQNPFSNSLNESRLYKTGDLARYLENGELAYVGRIDDQIKIMGYRIEPNEIVAVLDRHPSVQASVVIARAATGEGNCENACSEKLLTAYLVLNPEAETTVEDLRGFLRNELPDHMVPSIFVRLESLPLTPNGKVDSKALPAPDAENTLWDNVFTAPRNPLEERLTLMLSALLGIEQVSVNDNFFLLGGHSLLGTQLIGQIRGAFGVDLALRSLFDAPTIAELALELSRLLMAKVEAMSEEEALRLLA